MPRKKRRKQTRVQRLLSELRSRNASEIASLQQKLEVALATQKILKEATSDAGFSYEFIFCEISRYNGKGLRPVPAYTVLGSGSFTKALSTARQSYRKHFKLRRIEAECIVWVDFPQGDRIMLFKSFRNELMEKVSGKMPLSE